MLPVCSFLGAAPYMKLFITLAWPPASSLFSLLSLSAVTLSPDFFYIWAHDGAYQVGGTMGLSLVLLGPSLQWILEACCGPLAGGQ